MKIDIFASPSLPVTKRLAKARFRLCPQIVDRRRTLKISINVVIQICRNLIKRFCKSIEDALSNAYAPNLGSGGGKTNCLCVLEVGLDGRDHDASFNRE